MIDATKTGMNAVMGRPISDLPRLDPKSDPKRRAPAMWRARRLFGGSRIRSSSIRC